MFLLARKVILGAEKLGVFNHFHVSYRNDSLHLNEFLKQKCVSNTQIETIINQQKTFYNYLYLKFIRHFEICLHAHSLTRPLSSFEIVFRLLGEAG